VTDACGKVSENSCSINLEEAKKAGVSSLVWVGIGALSIGTAYLLLKRR